MQNTGYYLDEILFCPGDAFTAPKQPAKAVLVPITAPFLKLSQVIDYCNATPDLLHIGVHDGIASQAGRTLTHTMIKANIAESVKYIVLGEGDNIELT